jgi:hypothetical protein
MATPMAGRRAAAQTAPVAAAAPISVSFAVISTTAAVVVALLLVAVLVLTVAVLLVVFRLMADHVEDERRASPGPG